MPVFELTVVLITGLSFPMDIYPSDSILDLKQRIEARTGHHPDVQRLIYLGRSVEEGRDASDYNMRKDTKLHVVLRLRGQAKEIPKTPLCNNKYVKLN